MAMGLGYRLRIGAPALALALAGCHNASDIAAGSPPGPVGQNPAAANSRVEIVGLDHLHQTATVVTKACRFAKLETDRRRVAESVIRNALSRHAAAMPSGLRFEIESLSLRVRCHEEGVGRFSSYCASDASLTVVATGKDGRGLDVRLQSVKEATERVDLSLLCIEAMPAVTKSVDAAVDAALVDVQRGLTSHTGVAAQ